jgi:hypothetical protein
MKKIIAMAIGLKKENTDDALVDVMKEPWATKWNSLVSPCGTLWHWPKKRQPRLK